MAQGEKLPASDIFCLLEKYRKMKQQQNQLNNSTFASHPATQNLFFFIFMFLTLYSSRDVTFEKKVKIEGLVV